MARIIGYTTGGVALWGEDASNVTAGAGNPITNPAPPIVAPTPAAQQANWNEQAALAISNPTPVRIGGAIGAPPVTVMSNITPEALKNQDAIKLPTIQDGVIQNVSKPTLPTTQSGQLPFDVNKLNTTPLGGQGVNALFTQYYGRNATQQELDYWSTKSDKQLRPALFPNSATQLFKNTTVKNAGTTDLTGAKGDGTSGVAADVVSKTAADQAIADIEARKKLIQDTKTATQKQDEGLGTLMASLAGDMAGQSAYTAQQHQALVDPLETQLTTIQNQITAMTAAKEAARVQQEGKPVTMLTLVGAEAQRNAVYNSEILTLTAQANGLMNNITLAEKQVTQAVDAKYAPILEAFNIAKTQRDSIADIVSKDEKIQLDTLNALDQQKQQIIADTKSSEKEQMSYAINKMSEYVGAGINPNDSYDTINKKIMASSQYQNEQAINQATLDAKQVAISKKVSSSPTSSTIKGTTPITSTTPISEQEITNNLNKLSPRAKAVYENPSLINNYTATEKGKITDEIVNAGLDLQTSAKTSEAEKTTATYVSRMNASNSIISAFENNNPKAGFGGAFQSLLPDWKITNFLKSGDFQSMQQAERDFVNAVLRKESGAAIAASEFDSASKQYFPQPGDSATVIEQKKQNRLRTIAGMTNAAGSAIKNNQPMTDEEAYQEYINTLK